MRDIMTEVNGWRDAGEEVAIATVVRATGSTPRPTGAKMAMTASGKLAGSVSGGCLESAVYEEAMDAISTGQPRLVHYGISDEMAWNVGLSCGGAVDIFIEPLTW